MEHRESLFDFPESLLDEAFLDECFLDESLLEEIPFEQDEAILSLFQQDLLQASDHPLSGFTLSRCQALLRTNREYQEALRHISLQLNTAIAANRSLLAKEHARRPKSFARPLRPEGLEILEDQNEHEATRPGESQDAARLAPVLATYFAATKPASVWSTKEEESLRRGVRQQNQRQLMERMDISDIQRASPASLEINVVGIEWDRVAAVHVPTRSPDDCRLHWTVHSHPLINHAAWDPSELAALSALVATHSLNGQWSTIANLLGTNRTACQCLAAYQRRLRQMPGKWSEQEDRLLLDSVAELGFAWSVITDRLPGRTSQQCMHRFAKNLDPTIKRGRWTDDEDALLKAAIKLHGCKDWWQVQQYVPRRTDAQCRERWMNVLSPAVNYTDFSPEEDALLLEAVEKHGTKWSLIAQNYLPRRTDNQCWRRYKTLQVLAAKRQLVDNSEKPERKDPKLSRKYRRASVK